MTRIVQLANFYGPRTGGLKTVLDELGRCYAAEGIERVLVVPGSADELVEDERGTTCVMAAPILPGTGGYRLITRMGSLRSLLKWIDPDAVEVSDKSTLVAAASWARRRGVPATLISHERIDAILRSRVPGFFPLRSTADRWNARVATQFDSIVCPSTFAAEEYARIGVSNVAVVPWGVDLTTFRPDAQGGDAPATPSPLEVVCVGRLSKEKEPALAIEAIAVLVRRGVDVHLTMVGTGPQHLELERRSGALPVTFMGHVASRDQVAGVLARADVTVAPCRAETFGLSVLESLACGTPVVTSDRGASAEVGGECSLAVPPDEERMADAIVALAERQRGASRRAARARAAQFPWSRAAAALLDVHLGQPARVSLA